jgi:hypothetical protein
LKVIDQYRHVPLLLAIATAGLGALIASIACGASAVFLTHLLIEKFDGLMGLGGGVLVILLGLNTAVPVFIAALTLLVNWHHSTSSRTPTLAFAVCVCAIRALGSFDIQFAPFMLTTGVIAWIVSCWLLRKRGKPVGEHVI